MYEELKEIIELLNMSYHKVLQSNQYLNHLKEGLLDLMGYNDLLSAKERDRIPFSFWHILYITQECINLLEVFMKL